MALEELDELDFTEKAWDSLYDTVDDKSFQDKDANMIYDSLLKRLRFIPFGDYLKRYIYTKADLKEPFGEVPLRTYQLIIRDSFYDNSTPQSFSATTAKLSALSKNWLTQQSVKRNVVFLLGFGLKMSVEDVNMFLTKALREHGINPKDPFEVICWYCYENGYTYPKFEQLNEQLHKTPASNTEILFDVLDKTVGFRNSMLSICDDKSLLSYLSALKTMENKSKISVTAAEHFDRLYLNAREIAADIYNQDEDEKMVRKVAEYRAKLDKSDRLYDYEKRDRIAKLKSEKKIITAADITESDLEHIICSAIPIDKHGNLSPSKLSKLNEQFAGKRLSRQRIGEILSKESEVNRFDLITLNFFIYSQNTDKFANSKQRFSEFIKDTNAILEDCSMGKLYVQNPYECFVLMCILSDDPLGTYADVLEMSYNGD